MSERKPERKVVGRTVTIAVGLIAIVLLASLVGAVANYTAIISGKDNTIKNVTRELDDNESLLNQAEKWLIGNETLLDQTQTLLSGNVTQLTSQINNLTSQTLILTTQEDQLLTWLVGNETLLSRTQVALNDTETLLSICSSPQTGNAINYLTNIMFVPSEGLDKEAPVAAPYAIWLNDNFILWVLLSKLYSSRAETIQQKLEFYGFKGDGKDELFNDTQVGPFKTYDEYAVASTGKYTIKEYVFNGTSLVNTAEYADLDFLWSKNLLLQGNVAGALNYFKAGMSMWNGTGFIDGATNLSQGFATYKVGLALWVAKQLNQTLNGALYSIGTFTPAECAKMESIVWAMQDPTNGGIYTNYTSTFGTAGSDTNVETTAICLLYLLVGL